MINPINHLSGRCTRIVICLSLVLTLSACATNVLEEEVVEVCNPVPTGSFSQEVQPLFNTWCTSCHNASNASDGIRLDGYNQVTAVDTDRLLGSIRHEPGFDRMPEGGAKLPPCDILAVETWVNNGSPND